MIYITLYIEWYRNTIDMLAALMILVMYLTMLLNASVHFWHFSGKSGSSSLSRHAQTILFPNSSCRLVGVILRHSQASWETSSFQHVLGRPQDLLPVGHAQTKSPKSHPGGTRTCSTGFFWKAVIPSLNELFEVLLFCWVTARATAHQAQAFPVLTHCFIYVQTLRISLIWT